LFGSAITSSLTTIFEKGEFAPPTPSGWAHFTRFKPVSILRSDPSSDQASFMLTEIYIEALLVDEDLADQVCELWDRRVIDDQLAAIAWMYITTVRLE